MFKHILLAIDGSGSSLKSAREGVAFAQAIHARLTALQVIEHFHARLDIGDDVLRPEAVELVERSHDEEASDDARKLLGQVEKLAKDSGVPFESLVLVGEEPSSEILSNATKLDCDLILIASQAYTTRKVSPLGEETAKVAGYANVPVMVLH